MDPNETNEILETNETELPVGMLPGAVLETEPEAEPAAPEAQPEPFVIDGKSFATEAEALRYAQSHIGSLEQERLIQDAYRQGLTDSRITEPAAAAPPANETSNERAMRLLGISEEEFYSDVPGALLKLADRVRQDTRAEMRSELSTEQTERQMWTDFNAAHPDLVEFREDVLAVATREKDYVRALSQTKGVPEAMKYVAEKTRQKFQAWASKSKPARPLANGPATVTPGGQTRVTPSEPTKKTGNMNEELRNLRRSRTKS